MNIHNIVSSLFKTYLPDSLKKYKPLNIPYSSAYFTNNNIHTLFIKSHYAVFNLICNMGNHLNRTAQIITLSLL